MKKFIAGVSLFALTLLGAGTAGATSGSGSNNNTGSGVSDDSSLSVVQRWIIRISGNTSNNASITNTVNANASTGGNTIRADEDVENGKIQSGDASSAVVVGNEGNHVKYAIDFDSAEDNSGLNVGNIDDDSHVTVDSQDIFEDDSDVTNNYDVENEVSVHASSGGNTIESENDDVEGGQITSGEGESITAVLNDFNRIERMILRRMR